MIVPAGGAPPPPAAMHAAVAALVGAQPIGIPTDTVYGLAVDPFRAGATDRVFEVKRRPREVRLPVLVAGVDQALSLTTAVPALARRLMDRYWPGPLTIVLPARPGIGADFGDDGRTVGVRHPDHPVPQALCALAGPLATTSANRHGEPPMTTAGELDQRFGDLVAVVLDAGVCAGRPSTVVDCTGVDLLLLREGAIAWADLVLFAG